MPYPTDLVETINLHSTLKFLHRVKYLIDPCSICQRYQAALEDNLYAQTQTLMQFIIALWWWFCLCRVGGAVWFHTAWLFPLMPLPTLSLFYSYFLSGNEYRKTITFKNTGQFQFCIYLLPLELIWRSASCPRHWNQRWFGDAAFTIPSGKQWDHMSPWPPSWLSAGNDECCRSANESGHQWLKNSWLEAIWH